jgi:hypothetical protein
MTGNWRADGTPIGLAGRLARAFASVSPGKRAFA